jgi:D-tyrosyl-tRNA(Tyr) deacylase
MVLCLALLPRPLRAEAVVVVSEADPVATAVAARWGTLPASSEGHVDGTPLRRLGDRTLVLRRPLLHIHDEGVDGRLPRAVREGRPTLIFPSIHRSVRNVSCVTVHPLGNPGARAEVGGRPRTLVPTDPRRMTDALRLLGEGALSFGWGATYEATHHGPAVELPAFFIEIGYGELPGPPGEAVRLLAGVIPRVESDPLDRVALGVGGGHYAPHFTDLARHRRWAFGHLLSRHALLEVERATVLSAYQGTDGAEGVVYARAEDARHPVMFGLGPRLRDQDAPAREPGAREPPTGGVRSASGT